MRVVSKMCVTSSEQNEKQHNDRYLYTLFFSCGFTAQSNSEFIDKLYIFTNVALDKDKTNLRWKKTFKITQIEKKTKQKNVQE